MKYRKYWFPVLFLLPLALGAAGYILSGETFFNSVYAAFALYFVNPVSEAQNLLIDTARWLAPLVTASSILLVMKNAVKQALCMLTAKRKNSFALCGDADLCEALAANIGDRAFISENGRTYGAENAVLLFSSEEEGFAFYNAHQKTLRQSNVMIHSESMEMFFSPKEGFSLFNLTELSMSDFWLKHSLLPLLKKKNAISVALIGGGIPAHKLLEYAVFNNIFTPTQEITYYIFDDPYFTQGLHNDLSLMNGDRIVCCAQPWQARQDVLDAADRIVFTDPPEIEALLGLADRCRGAEIFCHGVNGDLLEAAARENIFSFGSETDVLTEENVTGKNLYAAAIKLNFAYACKYGEADGNDPDAPRREWEKLNAFTKHSNIASAAYHRVRMQIHPGLTAGDVDDVLGELEHIRWSRFHYWYHWKPGADAAGKKDSANRLHPCLIPYAELSREDKNKDIDGIRVLLAACADH